MARQTRKDPEARFQYKFNLTKQLYNRGLKKDDILTLYKFIDYVMALPEALEIRYNKSIHELEEQKTVGYITSAERIGMKKGFEQGIQQGRQEGVQQGRTEERKEIAKELWQQGLPLENISKAMKTTVAELQALLAEQNIHH